VAEWSIAPVLKTGGPQGPVSSNLTASATNGTGSGLTAWTDGNRALMRPRMEIGRTHGVLASNHAPSSRRKPMTASLDVPPSTGQLTLFGPAEPPPVRITADTKSARSGTFADNVKLPVHRWFRYSAGFSAEWVQRLVQERSPSAVLDPFAGSGTTLLAAQAAGAMAYGFESHPFVARIASAKAHWDQGGQQLIAATRLIVEEAMRQPARIDGAPDLLLKCYTAEALAQLHALRDAYVLLAPKLEPAIAELAWLGITSILRACSFVGTAQWQYVLPNKRKARSIDPLTAFSLKISEMVADMNLLRSGGTRSDARVALHDARIRSHDLPDNSIDLVVTSPPYPNNYDYADATRLEMTFWGEIRGWGDLQDAVRHYLIRSCSQHATAERLDLDSLLADPFVQVIANELSAVCRELAVVRQTKGGKKAYHTMIAAYFCDLARVFRALRPPCADRSTLCFVVGDSAPYGVHMPVEEWLGHLALSAGFRSFRFEKLRDRNIKWKNRKHRVPLHEGRLWIEG
jgi:DNA methylase